MSVVAPSRPPRGDDPDALIEEARERAKRRRRRGALLALLALASTGVGLTLGSGGGGRSALPRRTGSGANANAGSRAKESQEARQIARLGVSNLVGDAALLAPGVGYAMNGGAFYWTSDGGHSWRVFEPAFLHDQDVIDKVDDVAYAGPGRVWLALSNVIGSHFVGGSDRYATIARTTDGGRSWQADAPSGCGPHCGEFYLSFLDRTTGFALAGVNTVNSRPEAVYATTDAGASWTRVAKAPFAGPIDFPTPQSGWAVSDPSSWTGPELDTPVGGGLLYRTTDGGRTWERVRISPPRRDAGVPAIVDSVRFFGVRDGVVPVRYRDPATGAQRLVVYATADGGRSWSAHPAPEAANLRGEQWGIGGVVAFSAASATDWLFFAGRTLYVTADSGRSWQTIRSPLVPAHPFDLTFTSATTGWALFPVGSGPSSGLALVATTNGGRTWRALAPITSSRQRRATR
jgi:photosystem II stability/assembly factor-like uncharacterized protein